MNYRKLLSKIKKTKKIIVFGTSSAAHTFCQKVPLDIAYFVDNNSQKWDTQFLGKPVKNPQALSSENDDQVFFINATSFFEEISQQLSGMGFIENKHFTDSIKILDAYERDNNNLSRIVCCAIKEVFVCILAYFMSKELFQMLVFKLKHGGLSFKNKQQLHFWIGKYIEYPRAIKYLKPKPQERILDIGSGTGLIFFPFWLLSFGCKVNAIDLFQVDIGEFKELPVVKNNRGKLITEKQDAKALTYESNYFDKITCICSIEHEDDDMKMIKEMGRVLKKNGTAVLTFPINSFYKEIRSNELWGLIRLYDSKAISERLIEPSGLSLEKIEYWKMNNRFKYDCSWEGGHDFNNMSALKSLFYYSKVKETSGIDNLEKGSSYGFDLCVLVLKKTGQ